MVKTLIYFCLSSVDATSCNADTALFRVRGPEASVEQCAFAGETILAAQPHPILGRQYAKIVCERLEARR